MSDIPNLKQKIQFEGARFRSPVSEALIQAMGGALNFCIDQDLQVVEFTANGFWTVPDFVTKVILLGCGGGGGGAPFGSATIVHPLLSGAGGSSAIPNVVIVPVVPTTPMAITIGSGGAGGITGGAGTPGGFGGDTLFGSTTFSGAPGAFPPRTVTIPGSASAQIGFPDAPYGAKYIDIPPSQGYIDSCSLGGAYGAGMLIGRGGMRSNLPGFATPPKSAYSATVASNGTGGSLSGGFGGGTGMGPGGNGGNSTGSVNGQNAPATSYGAGGGGGGVGGNGGAGAPGYLAIYYFGQP